MTLPEAQFKRLDDHMKFIAGFCIINIAISLMCLYMVVLK